MNASGGVAPGGGNPSQLNSKKFKRTRRIGRGVTRLGGFASAFAVGGAVISTCSVLTPPKPTATGDRLDTFDQIPSPGFEGEVKIAWDRYQVPFVKTAHDLDAAKALGMVQAHLRLGQMEVGKRISQGRISEMVGPFTREIDHGLRALGYGRAAQKMLKAMAQSTRDWLEAYVRGVNHYKYHMPEVPHEYAVLGMLREEPWTAIDSLTLGRLASTDVNWLVAFSVLPHYGDDDFDELWRQLLDYGLGGAPTAGVTLADQARNPGNDEGERFVRVMETLVGISRSGSNSIVVSGDRTTTGKPMIANDPHLGTSIPNLWLIAGLECPSYNAVGMMVPGLPVFGFGRTPHLAWGGTNMRSYSSDLVDVSELPAEDFETETHTIKNRMWPATTRSNRISPYGPVVSDAAIIPTPNNMDIAVMWTGHKDSDEVSAFLGVLSAKSPQEFREAMGTFAVPGQNFLIADTQGDIAHVIAAWLPERSFDEAPSLIKGPAAVEREWAKTFSATDLPMELNPERGYIASANNVPHADPPTRLGFFFSNDQRIRRVDQLFSERHKVDLEFLKELQTDTYSIDSMKLLDVAADVFVELGPSGRERDVVELLGSWDGRYDKDSRAALVFEAWLLAFAESLLSKRDMEQWGRGGYLKVRMLDVWNETGDAKRRQAVAAGLRNAAKLHGEERTWGDIHKIGVQHYFGNIPVFGGRYRAGEIRAGGTISTLMKSAHELTSETHRVTYGSQSRHLSSMADPNANYFALVGGQDGWIGSENAFDQVRLWERVEYIQVPLSFGAFAKRANWVCHLH